MDKNILCCYQGGGYSGCYWEWNFLYIDENGDFHDIYSSGRNGIDSADKLDTLEQITHYVYHLENPKNLREFATETHCVLLNLVIQWFEENTALPVEQQPFVICNDCGIEVNYEYTIERDELICLECTSCGSCEECGEYAGREEIILVYDKDNEPHYVCEYCKDEQDYQSKEEREDLRFQTFTTGTPDLFSPEMAWHWRTV